MHAASRDLVRVGTEVRKLEADVIVAKGTVGAVTEADIADMEKEANTQTIAIEAAHAGNTAITLARHQKAQLDARASAEAEYTKVAEETAEACKVDIDALRQLCLDAKQQNSGFAERQEVEEALASLDVADENLCVEGYISIEDANVALTAMEAEGDKYARAHCRC